MRPRKFQIYKARGNTEFFSRDKLYTSLRRTDLPPRQCDLITDQVSRESSEGDRTRDIYKKALRLVHERSPVAAIQYSLKRALLELGPTGHHFETYVARYFERLGYRATTCQTLQGRYVRHEVDVVAQKQGRSSFVECKFHNRVGSKNDVKVTLYVKARWDDLREGPEGKRLENFYLVSNTAFSADALTYARGTGLLLLGVNAPAERSFLEEIKGLRLYPITSLRRLSKLMKQHLLSRNIILAADLPAHLNLLLQLGLEESSIDSLLAEIDLLKESKA